MLARRGWAIEPARGSLDEVRRALLVDTRTGFFERHELAAELPADGERCAGTPIGIARIRPSADWAQAPSRR
jgi:hypothetical protein